MARRAGPGVLGDRIRHRAVGGAAGFSGPRAGGPTAAALAFALAAATVTIPLALLAGAPAAETVVVGLALFGRVFALNSAVYSYLILDYTEGDKVALNVGLYYMANEFPAPPRNPTHREARLQTLLAIFSDAFYCPGNGPEAAAFA